MTCHNRRDVTIAALDALAAAVPAHIVLSTFLVDDGSTDGTSQAALARHPGIKIIQGDGNLYWNAGMRLAWTNAAKENPDFFLWLNDDLALNPGAIDQLLSTYEEYRPTHAGKIIVVGKTLAPETGDVSYGGYRRAEGISNLSWRRLLGNEVFCDTMNGNCVLVPERASKEVGMLSEKYRHALGDIDYGMHARRLGYSIVESPVPVGNQARNFQLYSGARLPLNRANIRKVFFDPKGVPITEWFYFCWRNAGPLWPVNFLIRYTKIFFKHNRRFGISEL
jgi:GT2 family glycosyltransferase